MSAAEDAAVDGDRPVRIVQISDTHLSHRRAYAVPNVSAILDWIAADPPDLVVHTGDITADDPDDVAEADFARQLLQSAALPMVALPGNHDVGGFSGDRFDARRLGRVRAPVGLGHLGPGRRSVAAGRGRRLPARRGRS